MLNFAQLIMHPIVQVRGKLGVEYVFWGGGREQEGWGEVVMVVGVVGAPAALLVEGIYKFAQLLMHPIVQVKGGGWHGG